MTAKQLDGIMDDVVAQALRAVASGVKQKYTPKAIGKRLHKRRAGEIVYQGHDGKFKSVHVNVAPSAIGVNERSLTQARQDARPITAALKRWKSEVESTARFQRDGSLDRRRFVRAVAGDKDVYQRHKKVGIDTSITASIVLDASGSMDDHFNDLARAASATSFALEGSDGIDHEVRFLNAATHIAKGMDETFDPKRVFGLYGIGGQSSTLGADTIGLSRNSLSSHDSANKIMIVMTDGGFSDKEETQKELEAARDAGITVVGVFFDPISAQGYSSLNSVEMDRLYGEGNWVSINSLDNYPQIIQKHLQTIYKKIARRVQTRR
ncbi:MAG: VWA domain-containing protein [Chloroflexi bacterium]|nr:VWA domain-containing protein [Chloroflexota bacterium]